MKKWTWTLSVPLVAATLSSGCIETFEDDCAVSETCPGDGDGDTSTGGTGDGDGDGDGDTGGGDGDGDTGGTGIGGGGDGDGDNTGGMGGDPNDPCLQCEGETPHCNAADECVECLRDSHCGGDTPVCDTAAGQCVECVLADECDDPALPMCDGNVCVSGCAGPIDCERFGDTPACDPQAGTCVPCTAVDYASCGTDADSGDPYVCDALSNTCSTTETEGGASLCQPCISNANCLTGQACVLQTFDDPDLGVTEVGYFCFTKPGVDGNPLSCSRPYSDLLNGTETIDGPTADICGLAITTCSALNDFRSPDVDCRPDGMTPDDSLCGAEGLSDGHCRIFQDFTGEENDVYRCTIPCLSADDCEGNSSTACQTGTPKVCEL